MPLYVDPFQRRSICAHAESSSPRECCGLLVGRRVGNDGREVVHVWPTDNREPAHSVEKQFRIDPREVSDSIARARREGLEIVGIYHSHPNNKALPSPLDSTFAWRELAYVIVEVRKGVAGELCAWTIPPGRFELSPHPIVVHPNGE